MRRENHERKAMKCFLIISAFLGIFLYSNVHAFVLNVVDGNGAAITGGFRYLVEEDNTIVHVPGVATINSIGLSIHKSHAPVVTKGDSGANSSVNVGLPASTPYFVSVLPKSGYANSGAPVNIGQGVVQVIVHQLPLPTAQISVLAFVDQRPINNGKDEGEPGLGGSTVVIHDNLGPVSQDAFGNPLGTQYQFDPVTGQPVLDVDGNPIVTVMGSGAITTLTQNQFDAGGAQNPYNLNVGEALVKYIPPGKYGVTVVPPRLDDANQPMSWIQTTTIEGTPTIDAWVKANEPPIFIEGFGTGFKHTAFGFVKTNPGTQTFKGQTFEITPWNTTPPAGGTGTITGRLRLNHFSRPPTTQGSFPGEPVPECWVGLNDPNALAEVPGPPGGPPEIFVNLGLYHAQCNADSTFTIPNVPPGTYQLVTWDTPLDTLFGFYTVTVPPSGGTVNLGDILTFRWFGTLKGNVFYDANQNGFRDAGEAGIQNQNLNIRFRDGSIYQATPTDPFGDYEFAEVFPFFKWLVAEVDFARFKATGMTTVADYGGQVPPHVQSPPFPPVPPGPMYIADVPSFNTLTPQPQFTIPSSATGPGGAPVNNPNTGNNLSRTETGPVLLQAMHLFLNQTNVIDWGKANYGPGENGGITGIVYYATTRAEDDPRLAAAEPWEPGIPRVQVNLYEDFNNDGVPDGAAINTGFTDSWDDNPPSGCTQTLPVVHGVTVNECADAFHTWNQVRPGVFDGGYAFGSPAGQPPLPPGTYIVEVIPPPGYELVKEEDKNVDFGDSYIPSPLLEPPLCVGGPHLVPPYLALFPDQMIPAPFAGQTRPLCDRKQVAVVEGQNTAADFFLFTETPKAARAVGFANNDLAAEFNVFSPNFGEKLAPAWIPVSFRDWTGKEITRVYTDEFGNYNALLPSTYSVNIPTPTGVSPSMITIVLNDPFLPNGTQDPYYNPTYSVTPWTFDFFPGKTTYLDTPLVPLAAFSTAGIGIDTEPQNNTPVIRSVTAPDFGGLTGGPVVCTNATLPADITINSLGPTMILNPDYQPGVPGSPFLIQRNYGFGTIPGMVTLDGVSLAIVSWTDASIVATVPVGATSGRLMVIRGDSGGLLTEIGVNLNIVDCSTTTVRQVPAAYGTIQAAIDAANAGDIILVGEGLYNEMVIMYKPVRLQGAGHGGTIINGNPNPLDMLQVWHNRIDPAPPAGLGGADFSAFLLKMPFSEAEAPTILIAGELTYPGGNLQIPDPANPKTFNPGNPFNTPGQAAIDGFTLSGSKAGGGIFAVAGVKDLVVSNNQITNNQGNYAGGIAFGTQDVGFDSENYRPVVRYNKIHRNGGLQGPGGVCMNEYSNDYLIEENLVEGNLSRFNGGGIAHRGYVAGENVIRWNKILFNEDHFGALLNLAGDGGGIYIGGDVAGGTGAGNVTIDANLIQGNMTGSGYGGGIRAFAINGLDVLDSPTDDTTWYKLRITNNIIVNNVAALAGAGISLQDAARAYLINNTITNNDATGTSQLAFLAGQLDSTPQPSGVQSAVHSDLLLANIQIPGEPDFSNPVLINNIIRDNRSFFNDHLLNAGQGGLAPNPTTPLWDLGVLNAVTPVFLNPQNSILSALTYGDGGNYSGNGNIAADPLFVFPYFNVLTTATVLDEAGNNISVRYTPLIPNSGNYHVAGGASPAANAGAPVNFGTFPSLAFDFDRQPRNAAAPDIGADELSFRSPAIDFNGDLTTDLAFYRVNTGVWFILPSGGGAPYTVNWGGDPSDKPVGGNYDGSGATDIAIYRGSTGAWYIIPSGGAAPYGVGWGGDASDLPVPGDYDGDGTTDVAVYRVSNGGWYIMPSGGGAPYGVGWGGDASDLPVPGYYDGDGTTDVAVYRASTGGWYVIPSGGGAPYGVGWGGDASDFPAPGDYDGDGTTDLAVYRVSNGGWYIIPSGGAVPYGVGWGGDVSDLPVPGDYDGDGTTDLAVYRASTGAWYILPSGGGAPYGVLWGGDPSDIPVTANPALY